MSFTPVVWIGRVGGSSDPELVAAGGQLPDQVRWSPVGGIAAGLGAQQGGKVVTVPLVPRTARRSTWPSAGAVTDQYCWPPPNRDAAGSLPGSWVCQTSDC
jgi:hypothetical protein